MINVKYFLDENISKHQNTCHQDVHSNLKKVHAISRLFPGVQNSTLIPGFHSQWPAWLCHMLYYSKELNNKKPGKIS